MAAITTEYIAAGGNRHPSAADWDLESGLLAFGADQNVALWNPLDQNHYGVHVLLSGHTDKVNAVKFLPLQNKTRRRIIISGSVDKTIRLWQTDECSPSGFSTAAVLSEHKGSINAIAVHQGSNIFVSGAADATVRIWEIDFSEDSEITVQILQTIEITPRFFPLAVAFTTLPASLGGLVMAVAGTKNNIQVYVAVQSKGELAFKLQTSLSGHEGWIRALSFTFEDENLGGDILLASASQDKYIRLWRIHQGEELTLAATSKSDPSLCNLAKSLSNKAHLLDASGVKYILTFEALLLGHEDWIHTASWRPNAHGKHQLLSASADNSLAIWAPDTSSGIWVCFTRLGEISAQKGSTTATGSTGGFWIGLWSPNGETVVSLGRTGSWRVWNYSWQQGRWMQAIAVSGHVKDVMDICWAKDGKYLLSTGSDQTTRLHAQWTRGQERSWHEFSRPQIHGYDLNCIDSLGSFQFISGADEKLLRVFDEPKTIARLLEKLCDIKDAGSSEHPDAANIPVLGLSNKAIHAVDDEDSVITDAQGESEAVGASLAVQKSIFNLDHPPLEDYLARDTLWPEREKLYGHGYEISCVASSRDGSIVATACRASSVDHAVIRLFDTEEWHEVKPSLAAHSLTVTALCFSEDDKYLLSVGRDRRWAVFQRDGKQPALYRLDSSNPKGHTRMILDGSWAPTNVGRVFATASRDKTVKVWQSQDREFICKHTMTSNTAVTAVDILQSVVNDKICLAYGMDDGSVNVCCLDPGSLSISTLFTFDARIVPSKSVTCLSWRPQQPLPPTNGNSEKDIVNGTPITGVQALAVASEDSSLRIFSLTSI